MRATCLSGTWRATDQIGLAARAGRPEFDASAWAEIPVPGHWQDTPAFAAGHTRLLYRHTFRVEAPPQPDEVWRLRFDGVFYRALVWLNGKFAGEQEGYFLPAAHEVTRLIQPGENVLVVEVDCPPEKDPDARRLVLGCFGPWEGRDPLFHPGGIWRDVWLEVFPSGLVPGHLEVRAVPQVLPLAPEQPAQTGYVPEGEPIPATVAARLEFWSTREFPSVPWEVRVEPVTFAGPAAVQAGELAVRRGQGRLAVELSIPDARLWWTWDHGRPDLYRLTLTLRPPGGEPEVLERTFGIRTVEMQNWTFRLNGRPIFLRGAGYAPPEIRIARCSRADYRRDLERMIQANMNTVRAFAHVDRPEFYEEADRLGLLVWQDFPLYRQHARSVLPAARRQIEGMVRLLGHHPCIGLWCCHNEPFAGRDPQPEGFLAGQLDVLAAAMPSWNRSILDPELAAVVRRADPGRPVVASSGEWGFLFGGSDTHHYWGWYTGEMKDLDLVLRLRPGVARMVTEYGAQAFPNLENSLRLVTGEWPNLNWDELAGRCLLQPAIMDNRVPRAASRTLAAYVEATQEYQRVLHKRFTEAFRMRKYTPCGGALHTLFAECTPGIGFGIVDYWRAPKAAYHEMQRAFNPVYLMCPWPEPAYKAGEDLVLPLFLVNDLHRRFKAAWSWRVERAGAVLARGPETRVELPPDSAQSGTGVRWRIPADLPPGPADLVLRLAAEGREPVENRYAVHVVQVQE